MTSPFTLAFRCDVPWDSMEERAPGKRHCGSCQREVVDISSLTKKAARRLLEAEPTTCISYLSGADGEPIFRRPQASPRLAAVASMLLAACSAEEPTCEIAREPAAAEIPLPEESLLEADSRTFGGPLTEGSTSGPGAPPPMLPVIAQRTQLDLAEPGDPNDVDGVSAPTAVPPRGRRRPHVVPPVLHTRTAGAPMIRTAPPVPTSNVGGS